MKSPYPSPEARYQYRNRTFSNAIDSTPRWKLTMYFSAHGISPQQSFFMTERMMFTALRRPRQDNPGKKTLSLCPAPPFLILRVLHVPLPDRASTGHCSAFKQNQVMPQSSKCNFLMPRELCYATCVIDRRWINE